MLDKLKNTIPKEEFDISNNELRKLEKLTYKIPINYTENDVANIKLEGRGLNNISIDENALNRNISKIRYINNRTSVGAI